MAGAPAILWENLVRSLASTITGSSAQTAFPLAWLRDQLWSKLWRSRIGWNVDVLVNGALDFLEGTAERVAYLTPGNYPTPAAHAAMVTTAMNSAGQVPSSVAGLSAWYRPESFAGAAEGSAVAQWSDESGNGRHLAQATANLRPPLSHEIINGRPAIRFDGTGLRLISAANLTDFLGASGNGTVFVVYQVDADAVSANALWLAGSAIGQYVNAAAPELVSRDFDGNVVEVVRPATLGVWHIGLWMKATGNTLFCGLDDVDDAALGSISVGASTALGHQVRVGSDDGASNVKGYIAELIFFNTALSEEDRRRVSRYLAQKYGITDASTAPTWGNTYAATWDEDTRLFDLARTAGSDAFALLHSSGAHVLQSASRDLGYGDPGEVPADQTGETGYEGAREAEHGREWVDVEYLGAEAAQAFAVLAHNMDVAGQERVVSIYGSDGPVFPATPDFRIDLAEEGALLIALAEEAETFRHWRLEVDDISNEDGFTELGVLFIGPMLAMAKPLTQPEDERDELSAISYALDGAHYPTERPTRRVWSASFVVSEADKLALEAFAATIKVGGNFFFVWDAEALDQTRYVFLERGMSFRALETYPVLWRIQMVLSEVLG